MDGLLEFVVYIALSCVFVIFLLLVQAANIEAEGSGIHDSVYQLIKHEVSSIGRGKYSGTNDMCYLVYSLSLK